jgi:hypothetical protein
MAQDADFLDFVKRKKDVYDKGAGITVTNLMDAAENKFKTRVLLKTWSAPTKEQEQILAFTTQVNQLCLPPKKSALSSPKKDGSKSEQDREKKWAWKKILPKEDDPVTKVADDKFYHLACAHHPKQWVCHTTEECSKNPANNGVPKVDGKERLKMARIAAAAAEGSDEDPDGY